MLKKLLQILFFFCVSSSFAGDFNWHGYYRWEGNFLSNPNFEPHGVKKAYALHHLVLKPNIVAQDGLNIYSRFDILNNIYNLDSQAGQFMGNGPGGLTEDQRDLNQDTSGSNSNSVSQKQSSEIFMVNELYLHWVHEFGLLVLGRVPLNFGLGIQYNDGSENFDHWLDTSDLIGYKIVFGNFFIMPMLGKIYEGKLDQEDDVNDFMGHIEYDNPESKSAIGVFFQSRIASSQANDAPLEYGGGLPMLATRNGAWNTNRWNLYLGKGFLDWFVGMEAGFMNGKTGIKNNDSENVSINAVGIATEIKYDPASSWYFDLKSGFASGDDPTTTDKFEGYFFDKNYDIGFLMFNHTLGNDKRDFLKTAVVDRGSHTTIDKETISNAAYISPGAELEIGEKWILGGRYIYGVLTNRKFSIPNFGGNEIAKDLGHEFDLYMDYSPNDNFTWRNGVGVLFPGRAFIGGDEGNSRNTGYTFTSRAAVSF